MHRVTHRCRSTLGLVLTNSTSTMIPLFSLDEPSTGSTTNARQVSMVQNDLLEFSNIGTSTTIYDAYSSWGQLAVLSGSEFVQTLEIGSSYPFKESCV